jgi:hypothetical protein
MFGVGPPESRSWAPPFARILQNADQVRKFRHGAADSIMRAKPDEYERNGSALQGVGKRRAITQGEEGGEVEAARRRMASSSLA